MDSVEGKIIISGAGLSGLSAAVSLVEDGIKPLIIEKSDRVGGLARSIRIENQIFDIGIHLFYMPSDPVVKHLFEIGYKEVMKRRVNSALNIRGKKISPIPEVFNFIKYPLPLKLDLLKKFRRVSKEMPSLKQRLIDKYGNWLYEEFFKGYVNKKLPGFTADMVNGDWWGFQNPRDEFNSFSQAESLQKISRQAKFKNVLEWYKSFFFGRNNYVVSSPRGTGEICEHLKQFLNGDGVEIEFGKTIEKIGTEGSRLTHIRLSDGEVHRCDSLIWTGALPDLISLMKLEWPADLAYISTILILLVFRRKYKVRRKYLYEYRADSDIIFQRFYFTDFFGIESDTFGICAEISYNDKTEFVSDEVIISKAIVGLHKLKAISDEDMIVAKVVRERNSHPVYTLEYRRVLAELFARIYSIEGIFPIGRSGAFNNLGMVGALKSGWKIGKHCLERRRRK